MGRRDVPCTPLDMMTLILDVFFAGRLCLQVRSHGSLRKQPEGAVLTGSPFLVHPVPSNEGVHQFPLSLPFARGRFMAVGSSGRLATALW